MITLSNPVMLTKPCDVDELIARIRALLRRSNSNTLPLLTWEKIALDPSNCEVTYDDQLLSLTPKEYALLELFLRHSYQVLSARAILDNLWSSEEFSAEATMRSHLRGLRQKLKAAGAPKNFIETVYGLGYRLKSFGSEAEPATETPPPPQPQKASRQAKHLKMLAKAWKEHKQTSLDHLNLLAETAVTAEKGALNANSQDRARRAAHSLAGTLGTFGFAEGSRLARELEHLLQADFPLKASQVPVFKALVMALRREIDGESVKQAVRDPSKPQPLLLIVDEDLDRAQMLSELADAKGFACAIATAVSAARTWLGLSGSASPPQQYPDVVLLNLPCTPTETSNFNANYFATIEELSRRNPPLPVVAIADRVELSVCLEVLRRGGGIFLERPVTPSQILAAATQVLGRSHTGAKVMVVDDDPNILGLLPALLQPWGFKLTTLADPQQFWTVLKAVTPNLLVLDVEMPHASGFELCQLLRSDPHWNRLPVLFLSAHTDAETQNQAFAMGADDYVSKPIAGPELAGRILNRLERVRLLGRDAVRDRPLS